MSEHSYGAYAPFEEASRDAARQRWARRLDPELRTALSSAPDVRAWPPDWDQREHVHFFYRSSSLLTRDRDLSRVRNVLRDLGADRDEAAQGMLGNSRAAEDNGLINGLTRLDVHVRDSQHTPDVVEDLDRRLGVGVATPDHVFVVTPERNPDGDEDQGFVVICPSEEPEPVVTPQVAESPEAIREALWPSIGDPDAGRDVRICVLDTGLLSGASAWAPWINGVRPDTSADIEDPDQLKVDAMGHGKDGFADPYAGHGTFVSGVIRCVAPASDVVVGRVLDVSGFAQESGLIKQVHDALFRSPDIINLSAGGYTRKNIPSLAFQVLREEYLSQIGGITLVAAAGNAGRTAPFWPAAFPWCVAVGSMSRDGQRRSWFSNHGAWVDLYAPGEEIVNAYAHMKYKTIVDGDVRDTSAGIARWSGTSFSTPIVTGLIAARMSRSGKNARQAADAVLEAARSQFRPGVGPRLFP